MLSVDEKIRLSHLEQTIERGLKAFYEAGQSLMEIRDSRLYRENHPSFEEYCRQKWEMSKTHANRLIEASEVVESLTPIGVLLPANEAQARPLTALPTAERAETMKAAATIAPDNRPTAQHVQRAAAAVKSKPESPFQPSTTATVLHKDSPHYGERVEVLQAEGVIVQVKTQSGEAVAFLSNELATEDTSTKPSAEKTWSGQKSKPSHFESLELENVVLKQRCELLEGKLSEAIGLLQQFRSTVQIRSFVSEIQSLLA